MLSLIKVSVIIPVYNTQDFLKECIDSVVNQTLADIEIICINDGSSDSSLDMLEEYRKKDSRIRLISQSHIGVGVARNAALDIVRGEYILFLDSDDYLDLNSLEYLYNTSKDKNLDMLMFKITNFNNKTGKESTSPYFEMDFLEEIVGDEIFSWKDIKDCIFDVSVSITSKLFRKEMISDIRFPEGLIFEDNLFSIKTLLNAQRIYFSDRHLYHRRIHSNSITNSYHERFTDCMDIYDLIVDYIKEIGEYDEFHVQIFDKQCFDFFHRFRQLEDEYKNGFFIKLKDYFSNHKDTLERYGCEWKAVQENHDYSQSDKDCIVECHESFSRKDDCEVEEECGGHRIPDPVFDLQQVYESEAGDDYEEFDAYEDDWKPCEGEEVLCADPYL